MERKAAQNPSQAASQQQLDFHDKLVQPGKRDSTDVLLKKIKPLHQKLASLEQDKTDVRSLKSVKHQLIESVILHHKDRGVKAYAACCLADILRLTAPDAPYTAEELRDIFQFMSAQLTDGLKTAAPVRPLQVSRSKTNEANQQTFASQASQRISEVAYYTEYVYLLDSLAMIRSVALAADADVPDSAEIVTGFFEGFLAVVRADMSKTILKYLSTILTILLEEVALIPAGVMDCIIYQFENYSSTPDQPSFQLIIEVCNTVYGRLQRAVFSHFSEIQLKDGRNPDQHQLKQLTESHSLMLSIYRYSPGLLNLVVPLLEENLRAADEVPLRQLSTRTLGVMLGERPVLASGTADVAKSYPSAWRAWLGRKVDKSLEVRLRWVETSRGILINHPELRPTVEAELVDRIHDSDDRVRAAICKVIGSLDYETALHHLSQATLKAVGGRISDKKAPVRVEAIAALSRLWNSAYSYIESSEREAIRQFAWIPEMMLQSLVRRDVTLEMRLQITSAIKTSILPLPAKPDDDQGWADRLLLVASHLDDVAYKALERLTGLRGYAKGAYPYGAFVRFCEDNNGGICDDGNEDKIKAQLTFVINAIAHQVFVDAEQAKRDMQKFADINEPRLYKLFRACADPQSDLRTLVKARNEILRRLEQSHSSLLETFTALVEAASFMIINHSSIPTLIKRMQTRQSDEQATRSINAAYNFLRLIAKECPPMFTTHADELLIVMNDKKNDKLAEVALQALAATAKVAPDSASSDSRTLERISNIAAKGTPRQAKFAARLLAYSQQTESCKELVDTILGSFSKRDDTHLLAHLRVLSELALSAPTVIEEKSNEIFKFVLNQVMYKKNKKSDNELTDVWVDESELTVTDRAKLIGMRICTHRSLAFARSAPEDSNVVQPTFNLLASILQHEGCVKEDTNESGEARPHMRLRASLCMLKLANAKSFDRIMGRYFEPISYIMQDPCFTVRHDLMAKLGERLPAQRMSPKWNVMLCMVAMDVEVENILLAKNIAGTVRRACQSFTSAERIDRIEIPLARLLLVLTHHPDFSAEPEALKNIAKFIEFYLDCFANRDNIGLIYHITNKLKTVRDPTVDDSTNLYKLSELAQIIIGNRADVHHWTVNTYPGTVRLPRDIFHNLHDSEEAIKMSRSTFLAEETQEWAKNIGRKLNNVAGPSRRIEPTSSPKRRIRSSKAPRKKRRVARDEGKEEDSDGDESELTTAEEQEIDASEEMNDEDQAEDQVLGRGGRRGAKTKAKKAVSRRRKVKQAVKPAGTGDEESELTEEDED